MKLLRRIAVAFSLYSKIPMPRFAWKEEDMSHSLMFLPWVGAVIGALIFGIGILFRFLEIPYWAMGLMVLLIPIFITGGFHLDGYMDVKDALSSYAEKEKKLEILKDPHVGSFAIIGIITRVLLFGGAAMLALLWGEKSILPVLALVFWNARCLCGITSLTFPKAKKDGMLVKETNKTGAGCLVVIIIELILGLGISAWADWKLTALEAAAAAIFVLYYRHKMIKEFGGVTGDTAGFFITCFECDMMVAMALFLGVMHYLPAFL